MTRRVKIAVIGTGRMGSVHARNIARLIPVAELVAVCDIRLDVAQAVADELGIPRVVEDYHELLADPDIEAVLIASSTPTHAFMIKDAALAGKQIFCEKPLALEMIPGRRNCLRRERKRTWNSRPRPLRPHAASR